MDILLFHLPLLIVISLTILGLGILVYFRERKSATNKAFFFLSLSMFIWMISFYLIDHPFLITTPLFWGRATMAAGFLIGTSLLYFILVFPQRKMKLSLFWKIILLIYSVFIFLSLFTGLIVKEVELKEWGVNLIGGKLYFLYPFLFIFVVGVTIFFLIKKYKKSQGIEKLQVQYFSIGLFLFLVGSIILNMALPIITGSVELAKFGPYSCIFLIGFTALAITKYHLFGIRVILTELLVGIMGVILLVLPFLMPTATLRILTVVIFLLFLIFGYYLIKATHEESKRREEAEKIAVQERALRGRAEKLAKEFERLDRAKTQFILATQHHLRTPLSIIKGYSSMLLEGSYGKLEEKTKKVVSGINEAIERLIKLVNEFLDISQLWVGRAILKKEEIQIEKVIKEIIKELKPSAKEKGIYLKFEKPEELPKIKLDKTKIKTAIFNVVDNGIKYTQKGGVTIKIQNPKSKIQIMISDTGIGLAREEIKTLFTEFFERGKGAEKVYTTGRGIGLYIAKNLIEAHKGKIWAESPGKDKGSTFYIELPVE